MDHHPQTLLLFKKTMFKKKRNQFLKGCKFIKSQNISKEVVGLSDANSSLTSKRRKMFEWWKDSL